MNNPKIPTPAVCPRCGCWYQAGVQRCLDDGSALLQADNMVRLFGPEDLSSKNDTIVEVVVRGANRSDEGLSAAAARLKGAPPKKGGPMKGGPIKGGPSTLLMEPEPKSPLPADEVTRPPEMPLVLKAELGEKRIVSSDTGAKPWVPLDPSDFEVVAVEAPRPSPRQSPRWPRQPPGRERVNFFEVSTEESEEPATEIVVERGVSSDLSRLARSRRVTRRGFAIPANRRRDRRVNPTPGLTQHTPTLLRGGTPPAGVKTG